MRKVRLLAALFLPMLFLMAGTAVAQKSPGSTGAPESHNRLFFAHTTGAQEVPPRETDARGLSFFRVSRNGDSISYKLGVTDIISVTAGHIHTGTLGINGPVIVNLVSPTACQTRRDNLYCSGNITEDDLVGPLQGGTLDDLLELMSQYRSYVNVHTTRYPGGEVRGQVIRVFQEE